MNPREIKSFNITQYLSILSLHLLNRLVDQMARIIHNIKDERFGRVLHEPIAPGWAPPGSVGHPIHADKRLDWYAPHCVSTHRTLVSIPLQPHRHNFDNHHCTRVRIMPTYASTICIDLEVTVRLPVEWTGW